MTSNVSSSLVDDYRPPGRRVAHEVRVVNVHMPAVREVDAERLKGLRAEHLTTMGDVHRKLFYRSPRLIQTVLVSV